MPREWRPNEKSPSNRRDDQVEGAADTLHPTATPATPLS
jgi:hypothetical protein